MNTYKYKAIDRAGVRIKGQVQAETEFEAVDVIHKTCDIILKMEQIRTRTRPPVDLNEPLWVSDKVLSLTASQFAILLRSGLPAARTVEIVAQQTNDRLMKRILNQVAKDVSAGYTLSQSLEVNGKKIPLTFIETVRAGEESGTLENSFTKLEQYYNKAHKIRSKVRSAMTYPIFLAVVAVVVIAIVMNVSIPVIGGLITNSGGSLPLLTQILMGIHTGFLRWWWLIALVILALVVSLVSYRKTERGKLQLGHLVTCLPIFGKISRMKAASQFANTMATMLSAGMSVTQALDLTGRVMDNHAVGVTVSACTQGIEEGKLLGDVLRPNPYLPRLLVEMTSIGEESGALEDMLNTIGSHFDAEIERVSNKALGMIEPIMTLVLGLVIAFIVIALYLPMFTMYLNMG